MFPQEILEDIFKKILFISDEDFSSRVCDSPFGRYPTHSSDILMVCKTWLRIATPLLYECVVLRTRAQAEAFYNAVKDKKTGDVLISSVRRIRLEDHFGLSTKQVFKSLPNLSELFITTPAARDETIKSSFPGFRHVNPKRVILDMTEEELYFKSHRIFATLLEEAIKESWNELDSFEVLLSEGYNAMRCPFRGVYSALVESASLRKVVIKEGKKKHRDDVLEYFANQFSRSEPRKILDIVIGNDSDVRASTHDFVNIIRNQIDLGENLNKPKSNALNGRKFVLGNQKFLEKILNNELSSYAEQFEAWERSKMLQKRLCELMLVSSAFKRCCQRLKGSKINVSDIRGLETLLPPHKDRFVLKVELINESTDVDNLLLSTLMSFTNITELTLSSAYSHRLSLCHNLITDRLGQISRLVLDSLNLNDPCFHAIQLFPSLYSVELRYGRYDENGYRNRPDVDVTIPYLRNLFITGYIHPFRLNSLLNCTFSHVTYLMLTMTSDRRKRVLLRREGYQKLFSIFPSLLVLHVNSSAELLPCISGGSNTLAKIIIETMFKDLYRINHFRNDERRQFMIADLNRLNFIGFPALRELQLLGAGKWPWRDRDRKDWSHIIDGLVEKYGIKVYNSEKEEWRVRFKSRTQLKQMEKIKSATK